MKLLFTKNNLPLSKLIRWGLKEPCSHFVIEFDNKIVFHSNLMGTHIQWSETFRKNSEVVCSINYDLPLEQEEAIFQSILNKADGKGYDFKAFAYFIWRAFLYRVFGCTFPKRNKWEEDGKFLCTGLSVELPLDVFPKMKGVEDPEIVSPYQLYLRLL